MDVPLPHDLEAASQAKTSGGGLVDSDTMVLLPHEGA